MKHLDLKHQSIAVVDNDDVVMNIFKEVIERGYDAKGVTSPMVGRDYVNILMTVDLLLSTMKYIK